MHITMDTHALEFCEHYDYQHPMAMANQSQRAMSMKQNNTWRPRSEHYCINKRLTDTGQNGNKSKRQQTKTATIVVKTATTIGQNSNEKGDNGTATNQINNCTQWLMNCIYVTIFH